MKLLFILLCSGVLENFVFGYDELQDIDFQRRIFPKPVDSIVHRDLQLLNRKYTKAKLADDYGLHGLPRNIKKSGDNERYTAFPKRMDQLNFKTILSIPGSPYFQPDTFDNTRKTGVKKILSKQFFSISREKRSLEKEVDAKNPPTSKSLREKRSLKKEIDLKNVKIRDIVGKKDKKKSKRSSKDRKESHRGSKSKAMRTKKDSHKGRKNKDKSKKKRRRYAKVDGRRLIAGRDSSIEDYPYTVSIQKDGEHWCAGALLNPRLVITTANCVWKSNRLSRLKVRAGSRFASQGGQVVRVAEVMKHPGWSIRKNPNYDLALLLLEKNVKFSHSVHGLDLPNRAMMPAFDDAWVTSWGTERRDGVFEKREMTLQVYHARLLDRDICTNITQRFGVAVTENFICLAQEGRRAPCTRDTGAPAVSDGVLWGLASWGIRKLCGTERFPAMFSYVASPKNMDFISNATTYLMSEPRESPFPGRLEISHVRGERLTTAPRKSRMQDQQRRQFSLVQKRSNRKRKLGNFFI